MFRKSSITSISSVVPQILCI